MTERASSTPHAPLSPWYVRLVVFVVLGVIAYGAIQWIDQRAMQRMEQMQQKYPIQDEAR